MRRIAGAKRRTCGVHQWGEATVNYCAACGTRLTTGVRFCSGCGSPLVDADDWRGMDASVATAFDSHNPSGSTPSLGDTAAENASGDTAGPRAALIDPTRTRAWPSSAGQPAFDGIVESTPSGRDGHHRRRTLIVAVAALGSGVALATTAGMVHVTRAATIDTVGAQPVAVPTVISPSTTPATTRRTTGAAPAPRASVPADSSLAGAAPNMPIGAWGGHGRGISIDHHGRGRISYRVYKWCSDDPTPPCDAMIGNEITDGGNVAFTIAPTSSTQNSAIARVVSSTDPATAAAGEHFQITRMPDDLLSLSLFPDEAFCGPKAPSGACGA
jgi:hypothetical protein